MSQAAIFSVPTTGPVSPQVMAQRIDDSLKALLSNHCGAGRPSYAVKGTLWVSEATSGKLKIYAYDGADDHLFQTIDIATGKITYGDGTSDDGMAAAIAAALDDNAFLQKLKWRSRGIGELYYVDSSKSGVDIPPPNATDTVWVELTAGLTGVGGFNNGKLTSESVSGSAPLVLATAAVSFGASPINGLTIDLLNTEGRIVRPSTSPGTKQNDQFQAHLFGTSSGTLGDYGLNVSGGGAQVGAIRNDITQIARPTTDGGNGTPRTGNETRMKNVGVKAYMRIA